MNTNNINNEKVGRKKLLFVISIVITIAAASMAGIYFVHNYIISQAETRIQAVLQEAEALHYYVQQKMHPTMYQLKDEGRMPQGFYSPEILSSSYITRHVFKEYNKIRRANDQYEVEYRLAAKNPRNKINQADSFEISLTEMFNDNPDVKKHSGVVDVDGDRYLYYSRPFLRVKESCLKCHGKPEDAPKYLRDYYQWEGGYNLKLGDITAIEVIKTPLKAEYNTSIFIGVIIVISALLLIIMFILFSHISTRNSIIRKQNVDIEKNMSELKSTQNQLVQSEKMASLGVLTAGVSHEINNPLNFINGAHLGLNRYFNETKPELKEEVSVLMNGLESGIERITKIVRGLNHFSRDSENYNEACYLHKIIDNCLHILKSSYKHKLELEKKYSKLNIQLEGNEGKLHQLFIIIITNAIQSIEKDGKLTISTIQTPTSIQVIIEDNGCGIENEHLNKVIEPFFTTKDPGEGTGLGLSIAYNIIQEHHGKLNIESTPGKGTKVEILFNI